MQKKVSLIILSNENAEEATLWIRACEKMKDKLKYRIVDLSKNNWLTEIQRESFDCLLAKPPGYTTKSKQLFDERIYILANTLGYKIYPEPEEVFIYENKRFLSFWLKANKIPHPETNVFYNESEAFEFLKTSAFPIVGKINIGASGSGVLILKNISQATEYIKQAFSEKGLGKRVGPNLQKGNFVKRGLHYVLNPSDISKKIEKYKEIGNDRQSGFVILQEFIPHEFEWRVVRIGDSFFAHKKMVVHEKASGSLIKNYDNPPLSLLDFVKEITDKHNFRSQAIDIFEHQKKYLVNEMQCIFGQSDDYQMKVNGVVGRYIFSYGKWIFEEGNFNTNQCFDLRLQWVLSRFE